MRVNTKNNTFEPRTVAHTTTFVYHFTRQNLNTHLYKLTGKVVQKRPHRCFTSYDHTTLFYKII